MNLSDAKNFITESFFNSKSFLCILDRRLDEIDYIFRFDPSDAYVEKSVRYICEGHLLDREESDRLAAGIISDGEIVDLKILHKYWQGTRTDAIAWMMCCSVSCVISVLNRYDIDRLSIEKARGQIEPLLWDSDGNFKLKKRNLDVTKKTSKKAS